MKNKLGPNFKNKYEHNVLGPRDRCPKLYVVKLAMLTFAIFNLSSCKSIDSFFAPKAAMTQADGSLADVDLSRYIATQGECDLEGGYEVAASLSLRLGRTQFEDMKKTPWTSLARGDKKPIGSLITEYEFGLLVAYTGGHYRDLNAFLRGDREKLSNPLTDREWSIRSLCTASAINKLAQFQGAFDKLAIYRGANIKSKYSDIYKPKALVSERAFQSYSRELSVAVDYSAPGNDEEGREHVLFEAQVSGKVGIDMAVISSFPDEKEVLINADNKFCIDSVTEGKVKQFIADHPYKEKKIKHIKLSLALNGKCP